MTRISKNIEEASAKLKNNEVIAIPTETVYGLAGNALEETAVKRIYEIKDRPLSNPLIIHIPSLDSLETYVSNVPKNALKLAKAFWPGPLTLLLPKKEIIPSIVTSGKPDVAIRVPNHPDTLALLAKLSFPLAAPSANPFGYISPTKASDVKRILEGKIELVLDGGDCATGIESTIVGFDGDQVIIYRVGSITIEQIVEHVGAVTIYKVHSETPVAPGMLLSHYAPHTQLILTDDIANYLKENTNEGTGILAFKNHVTSVEEKYQEVLSLSGDLDEAAFNLYSALHRLDGLNLKRIVAERVPNIGIGLAINDKLERASFKK